jgi:hypothetical protein
MGLFSADSKSTTSVENTTQNLGVSDLSDNATVTSISGSENSIVMNDLGAIESAFNFAGQAQASAANLVSDLSTSTANTVSEAVSAVSESARTETENIFINLQKYALYGGLIVGGVFVVRAFKGSK